MAYVLTGEQCTDLELSSKREWLLTNGIGGFAMGTVSGIATRRYHGLLVAALRPPTDRVVLLAEIEGWAEAGGRRMPLSTFAYPGVHYPEGYSYLERFEAAFGHISSNHRDGPLAVERSVRLGSAHNTVFVGYRNSGEERLTLLLRPLVCKKPYHAEFRQSDSYPSRNVVSAQSIELEDQWRIEVDAGEFKPVGEWYFQFEHVRERERGLPAHDDLYCPAELCVPLEPGEEILLVGTAEMDGKQGPTAPGPNGDALETAARQFLVKTPARTSILAGYPWFTDWGRDTMIALPGICLVDGQTAQAREILSAYAERREDGLIPNRFTESGGADYNTVDATLWLGNAVYATLRAEWDEPFARQMSSALRDIVDHHVRGTRYGIAVDLEDGLLTQGAEGSQLTWMDAKIGDWVVTPRWGKAVEVNGLWINFLRIAEWLALRLEEPTERCEHLAATAEQNFEPTFWREELGFYLDVANPEDGSLRPNQVIAMGLPFSPARGDLARRALKVVRSELLTPVGLRTLGPQEKGYIGRFEGALPQLDAAYHQGTVWPWLLGPYVDAHMALFGDREGARGALTGVLANMSEYGLGGIAEVFDGDPPHRPNGCPWQAWSVAEVRRAWRLVEGSER